MQLLKALAAFYQTLFARDCEHKRVTTRPGESASACFCPDCGYKIQLVWTLCRCRTCGSRRQPKVGVDGRVSSLYRYCQHCGESDYQIVKKEKLNVHEMPYAILSKEVDYSEERLPGKRQPTPTSNPFAAYKGLDIVEGEVLRSEQVCYPRGHVRT